MVKGKIILIGAALVLLTMVTWGFTDCAPFGKCPWSKPSKSETAIKKVAITIAASRDTEDYWSKIIEKFKEQELRTRNLDVTVTFQQMDKYNYEDELLDRMVNKKGPNVFMLYNTWLPKYKQRITPMPANLMSINEFDQTFPAVAKTDMVEDGKIYSLPLYIDTLGLFYNKNMFANAGIIKAPETWTEFTTDVEKLTVIGSDGKIKQLGAALGAGATVSRSQDIVMLMVMQNNLKAKSNFSGSLVSFLTNEAQGAIKYYTEFANPDSKHYTWDFNDKTYSIDQFIQLRAAMEINYSYEIANIAEKTGSNLNYGTAPVPQAYPNDKINYASYWMPVVAKDSDCKMEKGISKNVTCSLIAWDFVKFAATGTYVTTDKAGKSYEHYAAESYLNASGRPAAHLKLAQEQAEADDSKLAPFAAQVLTARSWGNVDTDGNDKVLVNMIDSIVTTDRKKKVKLDTAVQTATNQIEELH